MKNFIIWIQFPLFYSKIKKMYLDLLLQVLDVDRMIVKTTTPSSKDHGMMGMENHPVIRTLYDHVDVGAPFFNHQSTFLLN